MGYAVIPADELNRHGRPQVYSHEYAGFSRQKCLQLIQHWEQAESSGDADADETRRRLVQQMRDAMDFFDRIGWQAPLCLHEEAPEDNAAGRDPHQPQTAVLNVGKKRQTEQQKNSLHFLMFLCKRDNLSSKYLPCCQ